MVEVRLPLEHNADLMFLPPVHGLTSLLDFSEPISSLTQLLFDLFAVSDEEGLC